MELANAARVRNRGRAIAIMHELVRAKGIRGLIEALDATTDESDRRWAAGMLSMRGSEDTGWLLVLPDVIQ